MGKIWPLISPDGNTMMVGKSSEQRYLDLGYVHPGKEAPKLDKIADTLALARKSINKVSVEKMHWLCQEMGINPAEGLSKSKLLALIEDNLKKE